jgi:hypothetical protein
MLRPGLILSSADLGLEPSSSSNVQELGYAECDVVHIDVQEDGIGGNAAD